MYLLRLEHLGFNQLHSNFIKIMSSENERLMRSLALSRAKSVKDPKDPNHPIYLHKVGNADAKCHEIQFSNKCCCFLLAFFYYYL